MSDHDIFQIYGPMTGGEFHFSSVRGDPYLPTVPNTDRLKSAVEWVDAAVADFLPLAGDWELRGDDEKADVYERLRLAGTELLEALAGPEDVEELRELFASHTLVQARTGQHVPWEFLYLGPPSEPAKVEHFLGATAVISRPTDARGEGAKSRGKSVVTFTPWGQKPANCQTTVGIVENNRLTSASLRLEQDVFGRRGVPFKVLPPLTTRAAGLSDLNDFLAESVELSHFNCHVARVTNAQGKPGNALYVTRDFPISPLDVGQLKPAATSIIVLNCCDSAGLRFSKEDSIADAFLKTRVAAVVATTAAVDDRYATKWADRFYEELLKGVSVVDALLRARAKLLSDDGNPLALIYALMGRHEAQLTDLRLAA